MSASVVVVGGGYGGIATAKALDGVADVVLVEPRQDFVHNVAALRGLVDEGWAERMFLPYDRLLNRGRVIRDRAVSVDETAVTLASGTRLSADFIVLATGSTYPFPAKFEAGDSGAAKAKLAAARRAIVSADSVLLLGAGPVGLELAGALKTARRADGHVDVGDDLRLPGQDDVFAIGDLTAIPEPKQASAAMKHAEVVAGNIRSMISEDEPVTLYRPSPAGIVIPLGPSGGATYSAGRGLLKAAETAEIKGAHLMVGRFAELLGVRQETAR